MLRLEVSLATLFPQTLVSPFMLHALWYLSRGREPNVK